jgi:hypothetical protein
MFAANAELQPGAGVAPTLGGDLDQLADAYGIDRYERVPLEDSELLVGADKARRVVAREAINGLGQIVRCQS